MKTNHSNTIPCTVTIMNIPSKKKQLITATPLAQCKLDSFLIDTIQASRDLSTSYPQTPVGFKLIFLPKHLTNLQTLRKCPPTLADTPYFPTDNQYIKESLEWEYNHHTIDEDIKHM